MYSCGSLSGHQLSFLCHYPKKKKKKRFSGNCYISVYRVVKITLFYHLIYYFTHTKKKKKKRVKVFFFFLSLCLDCYKLIVSPLRHFPFFIFFLKYSFIVIVDHQPTPFLRYFIRFLKNLYKEKKLFSGHYNIYFLKQKIISL